jgi:hypothetical protein
VASASVAFARARSTRHALKLGATVGLTCGLLLPPALMGVLVVALGHRGELDWLLETMLFIGGMLALLTIPLAVPCGILSGWIGFALQPVVRRWWWGKPKGRDAE